MAVEGFAELAARLRAALTEAATARAALTGVVSAYLDFAERRPALYDVMFVHAVELKFAHPETPAALQAGFDAIREALRPFTAGDDLDAHTEVLWAGLHGLATLMRGGRLPGETHERRIAVLIDRFIA